MENNGGETWRGRGNWAEARDRMGVWLVVVMQG